jgi:hypothetical protein
MLRSKLYLDGGLGVGCVAFDISGCSCIESGLWCPVLIGAVSQMLQLVRGGSGDSGLENLTLGLFFELLAQECKLMSRLVWY